MRKIKILYNILNSKERRNLWMLFVAVIVMAGLQVVSVASIMPFLSVASDPSIIQENQYLRWAYDTFGFTSSQYFLIALGCGALLALILSNAFIILTTWAQQRFVWGCNHTLSLRLLRSYVSRPYEYFLTQNSTELGKNILEEVREVTTSMMMPALRGLAKAIVAVAIIGFLFFVDPIVALTVSIILGSSYIIVYYAVRNRLENMGSERVEAQSKRFRYVNEAFGGIKELKVRGKEGDFLNQYKEPSKLYARRRTQYRVIKRAPRYILEAIAFGGIILIAVYLIARQKDVRQVVPMLGLYAFAGYRLMPALQQAFKGIASIRFNIAALEAVRKGIQYQINSSIINDSLSKDSRRSGSGFTINNSLVLKDVFYSYPDSENPAIRNLSMELESGDVVGLVGKTGSGKTTTIDIILGLLEPQKGGVYVDNKRIESDNVRQWQKNIGYVPQQIYLYDETIAQNIAFGEYEDNINIKKVKNAARTAQIYDFVQEELPEKWKTVVGERGVKLSGGQRQRIGIARALYHDPSVLVFDEATSALDQATESSLIEAIHDLGGSRTVILIAHRLSTVKRADKIIMLKDGKKVSQGTFKELRQKSNIFNNMAFS